MRRAVTRTAVGVALALSASAIAAETPHRLPEAIAIQQQLVEQHPGDAAALNDLGNLLDLAGRLDLAEEAYRQAIAVDPEVTSARYNLALLLRRQGQLRRAVRELREAVDLAPEHAWGHFQLGTLLEQQGRNHRAAEHLSRAFVLDPELLEVGKNPQLLDSRLVTRASLESYLERVASLESAPRQYEHPDRITSMLVPGVERVSSQPIGRVELETDSVEGAERDRQGAAPEPAPTAQPTEGASSGEMSEDDDAAKRRERRKRRQPRKPPGP